MLDQQVVAGINRQDPKTKNWLYNNYRDQILRIIQKYVGTRDAEDLTQEIFLIFYKKEGQFKNIRHIKQFLFTIAKRTCNNYLKTKKSRSEKAVSIENHYRILSEWDTQHAEATETYFDLMDLAAKTLSPQCKLVVILCYTHQEKNAEIARILGISKKTVANHKTEAYKKLKLELEKSNRIHLLNFLL